MTAIEPGMSLAHSVVPSSGSTAMSTLGPLRLPTRSPMNSIGASSRSPSPITTVPSMGSRLSSRRMASTAAWSAAFSLPRPRRRAEATAARSVTRTSSSVRMRSMTLPGSTVMVSVAADAAMGVFAPIVGEWRIANSEWRMAATALFAIRHSPLAPFLLPLDADHLRRLGDEAVGRDLVEGGADRGLGRRVGDEDERDGRAGLAVRVLGGGGVGALLHDALERDLLLRHV